MTWTRVGGIGANTAGTPSASTDSGTVAACLVGDLVVIGITQNTVMSDSVSNIATPTLQAGSTGTIGPVTVIFEDALFEAGILYGWARVTGAGTIGIAGETDGGITAERAVFIEVWRGATSLDPVRSHAEAENAFSTTPSAGPITPTAGDLLVGIVTTTRNPTYTKSPGWGVASTYSSGLAGDTITGFIETLVDTGGVAISTHPTLSVARTWVAAIVAFKPATFRSAAAHRRALNGGMSGGMQR